MRAERYNDGLFVLWRVVDDETRQVLSFGHLTRREAEHWMDEASDEKKRGQQ